MADADLVKAARFEVASREKNYPGLVASGKLGADEATVDFQAWHCIAEWLDRGRSPAGWFDADAGADRATDFGADCRIVVEWLLCEDACSRAIATVRGALGEANARADAAKADRLGRRLAALQLIAGKVGAQRRRVETLNRALREQRQHERKAA